MAVWIGEKLAAIMREKFEGESVEKCFENRDFSLFLFAMAASVERPCSSVTICFLFFVSVVEEETVK